MISEHCVGLRRGRDLTCGNSDLQAGRHLARTRPRCGGAVVKLQAASGEPAPRRRCRELYRREEREAPQNGLAFYRKYTEAILRRYLRMSMEVGRIPSCMPSDIFRGRVSSYRMRNFEDGVIFVHDVESCLEAVGQQAVDVLVRIVMQQYTLSEAAELMGYSRRQMVRVFQDSVDRLTDVLMEKGMLKI